MRVPAWTVPLVLAAAAVAGVVVAAEHAGRDGGGRPPAPLQASTSLSGRTGLFGRPLVARLALVVDRTRVDPGRLRVAVDFSPFRVAGPPSVRRVRSGPTTVVRYSYRLECLAAACVPRSPERVFAFAPAVVRYDGGAGRVAWPTFTVASRLSPDDLARRTLRLPAPSPESYRLPPRLLGWSFAALAALLVLGAGIAASRLLASSRRGALVSVSPLERALALVAQASSRAIAERRTALDRLAVVLDEAGVRPLAAATRRLAWSRPEPEGAAMTELVTAVRERDA